MNPDLDFEMHPDADSLTAFAERALGAVERDEVVAHLAVCARCRQVVWLAQAAMPETELKPLSIQKPLLWFASWRLAWIPTAALATAAALVVTFFLSLHRAPAPQLARVEPAVQPAIPTTPREAPPAQRQPALRTPLKAVAAQDEHTPETANSAGISGSVAAPGMAMQQATQAIVPSSARTSAEMKMVQVEAEPLRKAGMSAAAEPSEQLRLAPVGGGRSQPAMNTSTRAYSPLRNDPAAGVSAAPMAAYQTDDAAQHGMRRASAESKEPIVAIPSGLAVASIVTGQHHTLALDAAGRLFLSEDEGRHWEPVAQQWTGLAVHLSARDASDGTYVFELRNEAGAHWVSADGMNWQAR